MFRESFEKSAPLFRACLERAERCVSVTYGSFGGEVMSFR